MTILIGSAAVLALSAPRLLPQDRLPPIAGATIWTAVLGLRALAAVAIVATLVGQLPTSAPFAAVTEWCLAGIVPLLTSHRGVSGHGIGELALLVPAALLATSLLLAAAALARGAWSVGRWLRSSAVVGSGPSESLLVAGPNVLVAAAGLRSPRIVVSAGALAHLDDDELDASLDHERGHIERRHRYVLVLATLLLSLARFIPGSRHAYRALCFHLERDADEFALRRGGDALALASAISKAARGIGSSAPATVSRLGGADAASRLRLLLSGSQGSCAKVRWSSRGLAALLTAGVLALALAVPGLASSALEQLHQPAAIANCG